MSTKPAYHVLAELINHDWRTCVSEDGTDSLVFKGFFGEYEGTASANGKTVPLSLHVRKGQKNQFSIVI